MSRNRNWTYIAAVVIVYTFIVGTALGSFTHIVEVSHTLGLGWEAWTTPFLVDGIAFLGKMGRSARFSEATQKAGLRLMAFGGSLSLAANIAAGDNWGQRAYGVLLVVGFLIVEWYAGKLTPAPAAKAGRKLDPAVAAERARKAAITREANRLAKLTPAEKAALTRQRNREAAEMDELALQEMGRGYVPVDAPVSPAVRVA